MSPSAAWEILSDMEDIVYDHVGDDSPRIQRLLAGWLWRRVQLEMLMGEDYGEEDIENYRLAAGG
jgi:hypothetical protein